jgi:hypothetical protein
LEAIMRDINSKDLNNEKNNANKEIKKVESNA